jgi:low affinity Fe/Cu permease
MNHFFHRLASKISRWTGTSWAFMCAVLVVVVWACFGPVYHWSDTHQLVINTSTTIITFLMVFLIQNTQNRDTEALQVKLDELLRVTKGAHVALLDLEELDDKDLDRIRRDYEKLAERAREKLARGEDDTDVAELENELNIPSPTRKDKGKDKKVEEKKTKDKS